MHSHHHHHQSSGDSTAPQAFYGYCHDSGRMRMMTLPDYVSNVQTGYSNLYNNPMSALQNMMSLMQSTGSPAPSTPSWPATGGAVQWRKRGDCGCHERGERDCNCHEDCGCDCCIRCADTVEFARCGETRRIPITFDNDTRRERAVKLELGPFLGESGQPMNWQAALSETEFTLGPCGEKTVLLTVTIECGSKREGANQGVDACKVGYATVRAEGCVVRPLVVAVAVLPDHCGAHRIGCLCGCCC